MLCLSGFELSSRWVPLEYEKSYSVDGRLLLTERRWFESGNFQ